MKNYKFSKYLIATSVLLAITFMACRDDEGESPDPFPPVDRGTVEVNRILITFTERNDTNQSQTFEYYDRDGIGGAAPIKIDTIKLRTALNQDIEYLSNIELFFDNQNFTNQVKTLERDYVVCYRGHNTRNLEYDRPDLDADGIILGLNTVWFTEDESGLQNPTDGTGNIYITLNYQRQAKNGLCDPGVRIFEGTLPYVIK